MAVSFAAAGLAAHRRRIRTRVRQALGAVLVVAACGVGMASLRFRPPTTASVRSSRALADATLDSNSSSSSSSEQDESCKGLAPWELEGGIVVYICALLYVFVALAIICDDYFVASLEKITARLGVSQDVAGATFMAAGSSAPELFVALADNVFKKPEESLGIGTIVGSAIFNILVIIALSALLAGQDLVLDWRPLLRDSVWYSWAILALTYAVWDGHVDVYESALLFSSYACYILYMSQNERVVNRCCKRPDDVAFSDEEDAAAGGGGSDTSALSVAEAVAAEAVGAIAATQQHQLQASGKSWTIDVERRGEKSSAALERKGSDPSAHLRRAHSTTHDPRGKFADQSRLNPLYQSKYRMFQYHPSSGRLQSRGSVELGAGRDSAGGAAAAAAATTTTTVAAPTAPDVLVGDLHAAGEEQLGGYFDELWDVPESLAGKVWFVFTRPIVVVARLTIPDCKYPQFAGPCGFTATFFVSVAWIAFLSHYTVLWATKFGCIAGIPSALMGLTILAAGTSIPDALSSILVARAGHGDMAVSNALGSNVFDILLGLGLPFFVSNLVYHEPVTVKTDDLELSIFILFGILLALVTMLIVSRWRLRKTVGGLLVSLYVVYVVVSYLRGLGMI
ncbi:hypothetical protein PybrP1_000351 [[Pythium] brassicae (nom. inval.)]|nr:hypothetical protein PybrP1_000351 [[Pythium] brassicae (nom. inval.)]